MSDNTCETEVPKIYEHIVEETINSCCSLYDDDGLDKTVLDELKTLWLTKLKQSRVTQFGPDEINDQTPLENNELNATVDHKSLLLPPTNNELNIPSSSKTTNYSHMPPSVPITTSQAPIVQMQPRHVNHVNPNILLLAQQQQLAQQLQLQNLQRTAATNSGPDPARLVAVQILLPQNRVVHIQVPQVILTEKRLQTILTTSVIQATCGMTAIQARGFLQHHINNSYQNQVRSMVLTRIINQLDGQINGKIFFNR